MRPLNTRVQRFRQSVMVIAFAGICSVGLAAPPPPQVSLPFMKTPPTIDGEIKLGEWDRATKVIGFVSQHGAKVAPRDGMFWLGCDGKQLCIAVQTEAPPVGELLNRAVPDGDRDIIAVTRDDSIELWLDPHRGQTTGDRRRFQIIANARGTLFDRSYDAANPQNPVDVTWRVKWQYATKVIDGWWHVELAIPLSSLGAENDLNHPWGVRIGRNWQRPGDQSRWESVITAFDDIPSMPVVAWDAQAPVTQMVSLHKDRKEPFIAVTVSNPHSSPLTAKVFLSDAWSMDPPKEQEKTVAIAPGKTETVSLQGRDMGPEGDHRTIIRVTSDDGARTFFFRDFRWNMHRPEAVWTIEKEQRQAVDFQFKHYPYYGKVKAKVDVSALSVREQVTGARVVVRPAGNPPYGGDVLAEQKLPFKDALAEAIFSIPELKDGDYEVAAFLEGGKDVPKEPVVRTFARRRFEWERNKLGLSDAVIPPFTPLKVTGKTVSSVLREHEMNEVGLWAQVRSEGRDLLAAPMRWEVTAGNPPNGGLSPVKPGKLTVEKAAPHRVVTQGAWQAGALSATVRSEFDYDGMAKVTLSLAPSAQPIDRLSLVIPLRNDAVRYMHACGDGCRQNYAGKAPEGEGVVWDSSKGNKTNIVGTFYPYVYLGGGARGLCWFADNDRDWVLDDTTPTVQIVRQGKVVELRVHFITKPTTLTRPHHIVFGLQATPVKPMPEQPINWRKWHCTRVIPGCSPFVILGATYYWGCVSYDLYPRDRDFSIYDWIRNARETGKADMDFVKRWMEGYKPYAEPGTPLWKNYEASVLWTARSAPSYPRSKGAAMIPYTNARGVGFQAHEWPTFQDEWINFAYYNRAHKGAVGYDITPTESFRDCAMYYYQKAMACFDGVYWDNTYMAANWDTVAGDAWVDESSGGEIPRGAGRGRIHPSMGLWAMRELIRRTAVLYHEQGRRGVLIPHMTNTNIVPILAFANVNLDWEWQYGERDFQDRFTPELTVAQTIGRSTGNVPLILSGGFHDRKAPNWPWVMRTRLGVTLVHEIKVWDYGPAEDVALWTKLHEFGYGEPDCRVFNYWDEAHPVKVAGTETKTIAMSRGGRAVVIVTDYGEGRSVSADAPAAGGNCTVTLDAKSLGLPPAAKATDFETGAPVAGDAHAGFTFALKKHDFKALLVQ
ncbi:MAG: hypothetical protein FJ279_10145 [Planctomycetes bacterium]|nr:hypothetical protein [Planctomycetota bacterium]